MGRRAGREARWLLSALLLSGCSASTSGAHEPRAKAATSAEARAAGGAPSATDPGQPPASPAARALLDSCGAMRTTSDDASARRRCFALATDVADDTVAELAARCDEDHAPACALVGNIYRGSKLLQWEPQLWTVPCGLKRRSCARYVEVKVPFQVGREGQADPAAAARALNSACEAKDDDACLELADLVRDDDRRRSDELRRVLCLRGHVHACASSVFRWLRSGGLLEDPEIDGAARAAFSKGCDGKQAFACNNLAFVQLRGPGGASDPKAAAASFARACELGAVHGCANLLFLAEAERKLRRSLALEPAARTVGKACELGQGVPYECVAHGLAELRGYGTKRNTSGGRKRLRALCKDGVDEACRLR
jgi:TPR repeat protein